MSPVLRATSAATILAFLSTFAVGALIYSMVPDVSTDRAILAALAMGFGAGGAVFTIVWTLARSRFPRKRPVIGALRGAAIGTCVLIFIAIGHAVIYPGSAGVPYSVFGHVLYSILLFGWFASAIGGIFGKYMERVFFGDGGS